MKIKNLLIITILLLILLCFSQYSNKFYNKLKTSVKEFFENMLEKNKDNKMYLSSDNNYNIDNRLNKMIQFFVRKGY